MRANAAAWPDPTILQCSLAQLPWYHLISLIEKRSSPDLRVWYAVQAVESRRCVGRSRRKVPVGARPGIAFVGRQVRLEIGEEEFFYDLLFYHLKLRCFNCTLEQSLAVNH